MLNVVPKVLTAGLQLVLMKLSLDNIEVPVSLTDPATSEDEFIDKIRLGLAMSSNSFLDEDGL